MKKKPHCVDEGYIAKWVESSCLYHRDVQSHEDVYNLQVVATDNPKILIVSDIMIIMSLSN